MNVYIWRYLAPVNTHHHNGGAIVVMANNLTRAWEALEAEIIANRDEDEEISLPSREDPDCVWSLTESDEAVLIFPDSGCC